MAGQLVARGKRTWLVRVPLGRDTQKKRRYHNHTVHGTKKEAEAYLHRALHERSEGTFWQPTELTVDEYFAHWFEHAAARRVRERTLYEYRRVFERYLQGPLGQTRMAKLSALEIQSLYSDLLNRGLSGRTVRYAHSVLSAGLKQAIRWRLIQYDPLTGVELPRIQRTEREVLDVDGARRFLVAIKGSRLESLFVLALVSGMRPGEYLALRWADIDFATGDIRIQRSLTRIKGRVLIEEPKTSRSRRTVSVPTSVLALLREQRRIQASERKSQPPSAPQFDDLVFTTDSGAPLDLHNVRYQYLKPMLRRAGLPVALRLYDLRHACATILMMAGQNPKVVSERLGHASVVMTLDTYSHVVPVMQQQATAVLSDLLLAPRP